MPFWAGAVRFDGIVRSRHSVLPFGARPLVVRRPLETGDDTTRYTRTAGSARSPGAVTYAGTTSDRQMWATDVAAMRRISRNVQTEPAAATAQAVNKRKSSQKSRPSKGFCW